jgi:LacI family transcriptional regulator
MKIPPKRPRQRRVALLIETSRAYGRDLLVGVAQYVRIHGPWSIDFEEGDPCEVVPEWFRRWRGDGVIARAKTPALAEVVVRKGVPVVDLYGGLPDLKMPRIRSDELAVGHLAAQHLLDRGFSQFAFCGHNGTDWSDGRRNGFEQLVAEAGFPCQIFQNPLPRSNNPGGEYEQHGLKYEHQLSRWLAALPKPVGLMACNDSRARQVLTCCRTLELKVPDEVAVIGVDKDEVLCELSDIPLSSVILNTERIGFEAAVLLNRMMAGERPLTGTIAIAPKGIATRRSTEVLAVEDRHIAAALGMIREQACEGLDVPALVKALPISRSSLERRFAQLLGRSPNAEILRVKLDRTKQLLRESDLPLMAIAEKTGFQNQEYLSRVFKKKFGFTPGQFRAQSQQETGQKTIQGGGMVQLAGRPDPRHPPHSQTEKPDGLSKNKQ